MKLLFVIDRAHASDDPNINLVRGLLPCLAQLEPTAEIRFLGHTPEKQDAQEMCFYFGRDEAVRKLYFSLEKCSTAQKLLRLVRQPSNSAFGVCKALRIDLIAHTYRKRIEAVCKAWQPNAVIAIAAPFYTAKALAVSHIACRKILWMFDPYGTHYLMGGKTARRQEKRCLARMDQTFVPQLIANDYAGMPSVEPMAFPGLAVAHPPLQEHRSSGQLAVRLPDNVTNLVYVGSLYADIRNPAPLLRLVKALGERVHLTLVGGMYGTYSAAFHAEFDTLLARQVTVVDRVSSQIAQCYLQQADVLVNLGNTVENQLPSKIFECFASGLPLLNFKQIAQCPADGYMQRYPLAYTVDATQPLTEKTVCDVNEFLEQAVGKRLSFAQVQALYPENTPQAVAKKLLEAARGE